MWRIVIENQQGVYLDLHMSSFTLIAMVSEDDDSEYVKSWHEGYASDFEALGVISWAHDRQRESVATGSREVES